MSIIETGRKTKIANEYTTADQNWGRIIANMTSATDLTVNATAWLHDNIQNNRGDVSEADRVLFRASFEQKLNELNALMQKLNDCYAVYDADQATYESNLQTFIAKYPAADPARS
jgi:dolichyl-phosphate-mannose--protein O-mannosyl transferase